MKKSKENEIMMDIQTLLNEPISDTERHILTNIKKRLDKKEYFPKIIADLESQLTPLAISQKLSTPLSPLYLKITSHRFKDKKFGGGWITVTNVFR